MFQYKTPTNPTQTILPNETLYISPLLAGGLAQPVEALSQTIASQRTRALDVPLPAPKGVEGKLVGQLLHTHHSHILLVGQDQNYSILELVLAQHLVELLLGDVNSFLVRGVHHEDKSLSVLEVVLPKLPDLILSSDVPDRKLDLLELHGLDVEADGGNRGDDLSQLHLVQDGSLSRGVQTQHKSPELPLAKEAVEQLGE